MRVHLLPLVFALGCGGVIAGSSGSDGGSDGSDGMCCPPARHPACCMDPGGWIEGGGSCPAICNGIPSPSDPAWHLVKDAHGCDVWSSAGATGPYCGGAVDAGVPRPDATPGMPDATPVVDTGVVGSDAGGSGCSKLTGDVETSASGACSVSGTQTCGSTTYSVSCMSGGSSTGTCNCEISMGSGGSAGILNGYSSCSLESAWAFCEKNMAGFAH